MHMQTARNTLTRRKGRQTGPLAKPTFKQKGPARAGPQSRETLQLQVDDAADSNSIDLADVLNHVLTFHRDHRTDLNLPAK